MLRHILITCFLALPTTGMAQDVDFSPSFTNDCISGGGGTECIGASANACMEATEGGFSTAGMNGCLDMEFAFWDAELNRAYQSLMEFEEAIDTQSAKSEPDRPSGAQALRDMQRSWIAYRDATCNYEILQWYGGTGASPAWLSCTMRLTGQQAMYLSDMLVQG